MFRGGVLATFSDDLSFIVRSETIDTLEPWPYPDHHMSWRIVFALLPLLSPKLQADQKRTSPLSFFSTVTRMFFGWGYLRFQRRSSSCGCWSWAEVGELLLWNVCEWLETLLIARAVWATLEKVKRTLADRHQRATLLWRLVAAYLADCTTQLVCDRSNTIMRLNTVGADRGCKNRRSSAAIHGVAPCIAHSLTDTKNVTGSSRRQP